MHRCEYCDKTFNSGTLEGLKCTCDSNLNNCPIPQKIVCDGAYCQLQLTTKLLEQKRDELEKDIENGEAKLKELNNIFRIMGLTPSGIELLIKKCGVDFSRVIPSFKVNKDETWSWDKMNSDQLVTIGLHLLNEYERTAKQWTQFLNEKSVKIHIKKELIDQTQKNLAKAEKTRKNEAQNNGDKINKPKLTAFEKTVLHNMKILGMSQEDSIKTLELMNMKGECRNLKELGVI